jgi:hypothetical protein
MAAARITTVFCICLGLPALTQEPPQARLSVHVTDQSGAAISKSKVKVFSVSRMGPTAFVAESDGSADFTLPPGSYSVVVSSSGYCGWGMPFWLPEEGRSVEAKLFVPPCPCVDPCVTVRSIATEPEFAEPLVPESSLRIPLFSLRILTPLPVHNAKRHQ